MDESGDKAASPVLEFTENALVSKLLQISESYDDSNFVLSTNDLCGWGPMKITEDRQEVKNTTAEKLTKKSAKVNASMWSNVEPPEVPNKLKKNEELTRKTRKRRDSEDLRMKKKRQKYHQKRMEELSMPRKKREKFTSTEREKTLFPASNHILNAAVYHEDGLKSLTRIALQYGATGPELRRLSLTKQAGFQNKSHSAHERQTVEKSLRELLTTKSQSASSIKHGRGNRVILPSILVKTRENSGVDWETISTMSNSDDSTIEPASYNDQNINLPLPRAKLPKSKTKTQHGKSDASRNAYLPSITVKSKKHKRVLGSVTAITQGNINAGIKTNSIRQLRRQVIPQANVVLPRLSGSRVEVPLLPQSPDFLRRFL